MVDSYLEQAPPPYSLEEEDGLSCPYQSGDDARTRHDPRNSSMQSLVADQEAQGARRKLLLIYIHGFMGNETSFKSFPAHVHNLVSVLLAESHVVHSKIYPRYKSRKSLDIVANDFSAWLTPNASPNTDIILLGHSMGGLLSAQVVILPPRDGATLDRFRHQILATINFDVPFLGIHPSVVASGLSSIFKSSPEPASSPLLNPEQDCLVESESGLDPALTKIPPAPSAPAPQRRDTIFGKPTGSNFNPSFTNDINLPVRKGWQSTVHFLNKHSNGLRQATAQYVRSHVEFGGAMADYRGLHNRYNCIRSLEEPDEANRRHAFSPLNAAQSIPRVRFINYYTACSARPKSIQQKDDSDRPTVNETTNNISSASSVASLECIVPNTQTVEKLPQLMIEPAQSHSPSGLSPTGSDRQPSTDAPIPIWPPLSPDPAEPTRPDLTCFPDKLVQDALKREYERNYKTYKQLLKDRETTLADRKKVQDKIQKDSLKRIRGQQNLVSPPSSSSQQPSVSSLHLPSTDTIDQYARTLQSLQDDETREFKQPAKDRHFCLLPRKNNANLLDPTWVRVYMHGVDQVGAHCGLFDMSDSYERLVGDVGARIEEWVLSQGK